MKTLVTRSPDVAARFVRAGEVVAFPTETVYGLGAALFDESAIRKIFAAKERPADNPLIAHVASVAEIGLVARELSPAAERLVEAFFPGPLTLVLPKRPEVPLIATAGLETIGVRMPADPIAHAFLVACGGPVVAPSANRSGRPSPTTWEAVLADLDGRIPCVLAGDPTRIGLESTVVDCSSASPLVLRAGAVSLEQLRSVVGDVVYGGDDESDAAPRSPGTRHRHYAPAARVRVVASDDELVGTHRCAYIGNDAPPPTARFARVRHVADVDEYARYLFAFFRACDADSIPTIFCQAVEQSGIGVAVNDRISRAAAAFLPLEK
jgi:L-threonylcarbamoyladenylate synthase